MIGFLKTAELFHDCWILYRKHYGQTDWDGFVAETKRIHEKYEKDEFAKEMLVAVMNEMERLDKVNRRKNDGKID